MTFVSIRVITADVARLVAFYEHALDIRAAWATPDFAELRTGRATLAVGGTATLAAFPPGLAEPAANRSVIIEFLVDDVDALHGRLREPGAAPVTMPWGNRSLLTRDPDGHLVNFFTPVTAAARAKYADLLDPAPAGETGA